MPISGTAAPADECGIRFWIGGGLRDRLQRHRSALSGAVQWMTYGVRHAFWPSDAITNQFTELAKSLAHSAMHVQMEVADRIVDHAPKLRQLERGITSARFLPGNTKSHFRRSYTMKNQRTLLCLA